MASTFALQIQRIVPLHRGDLSEQEKETLRAVYLARLVPNYSRQWYLKQLLEYAAGKGADAGSNASAGRGAGLVFSGAGGRRAGAGSGADAGVGGGAGVGAGGSGVGTSEQAPGEVVYEVEDEIEDEVLLLNVLEASKIVKRPRRGCTS